MMSQLVYVVNQNGQKLMPCKPAKARKLLRGGRAKVAARSPFTIQLLWECEEHIQEVVLGIDKGSHVTGFACVGHECRGSDPRRQADPASNLISCCRRCPSGHCPPQQSNAAREPLPGSDTTRREPTHRLLDVRQLYVPELSEAEGAPAGSSSHL